MSLDCGSLFIASTGGWLGRRERDGSRGQCQEQIDSRPLTLTMCMLGGLGGTMGFVVRCFLLVLVGCAMCVAQTDRWSTELRKNWTLQSSCSLKQGNTGEFISTSRFRPTGWIATEVPHTVEGAQVDAKVFPFDPFVGMNLR